MALVGFLFPGRQPKVRGRLDRYLGCFLADPQFQYLGDPRFLERDLLVVPEAVHALFDEFRKYLRCSCGSAENILVEVRHEPAHAAVIFTCSAFQPFKEERDVRLAIFRQVAYQLEGDFHVGKGWCRISLPVPDASAARRDA
jgi:hypothetical protein